ncbi:hypothetical protein PMIN06_012144 [Paraphaeosphaeria minitans]
MEMIFEFSLRGEEDIVKARGILKNILKYALPAFEKRGVKGKGPTIRAGMSTVAPSEAGPGITFQLPITSQSSTSDLMKKKRKLLEVRVEANDADTDSLDSLPNFG